MSLDSVNITKQSVKKLIHELYPAIQHQFVLIASENDLNENVFELLNDLKNEFQSLTTYENKLVFPSALKKSESKKHSNLTQQINLSELIQLTIGKENRLLQIVDKLSTEIKKNKPSKKDNSIVKLIQLFKNDFSKTKNYWNQTISKL